MAEVTCKALRPRVPAFLFRRTELAAVSAAMYHARMNFIRGLHEAFSTDQTLGGRSQSCEWRQAPMGHLPDFRRMDAAVHD